MQMEIEAVSLQINANEEDSFSIKMSDGTRLEIHYSPDKDDPRNLNFHCNIRFASREIRVMKDQKEDFHVEGFPSGNALVEEC